MLGRSWVTPSLGVPGRKKAEEENRWVITDFNGQFRCLAPHLGSANAVVQAQHLSFKKCKTVLPCNKRDLDHFPRGGLHLVAVDCRCESYRLLHLDAPLQQLQHCNNRRFCDFKLASRERVSTIAHHTRPLVGPWGDPASQTGVGANTSRIRPLRSKFPVQSGS